ncbi:UDP-N-acetyl glucosamine 2-epimerase [Marinicella litoralis]|uniref:UDP-N-acetylglucosamine 2-epimerase (Non-hydrolysing) n=1 Tax=Marinicella litoralis TaxID=644220 RepID=A0A4R6XXN3_9GAMM|nr:UDP-N-acetylglucosamine 2-epimerase [Marinicella litoralis]TDR23240.1 UDP-N-acetylglucosamine 2-epimerase (non-hydrolysing) [Marinicella litoralis]
MITCIIGTRAQLIKMAPVIKELELHELKFQILLTGQHKETMDTLLNDFAIQTKPIQLEKPNEISSIFRMVFWFPRTLIKMFIKRKQLFECEDHAKSWILVHGDTLSTLLGALVGKFTRCQVAHIESGLRSNSFFSPFPEEITRVLTFYLSDVGFCPGQWAVDNLKKYRIKAVNTETNTIIDSVNVALASNEINNETPSQKYAVVSIHRFENIYKKKRFRQILDVIHQISNDYLILFVLHPTTKKRLVKYDWMDELTANNNIFLKPRMGYIHFVKLLSQSSFVITDGGSNQEELAYLNIPTLVMRDATERPEGIGETAVLNGFEQPVVEAFLNRIKLQKINKEAAVTVSPSKLIVEYLINNETQK